MSVYSKVIQIMQLNDSFKMFVLLKYRTNKMTKDQCCKNKICEFEYE